MDKAPHAPSQSEESSLARIGWAVLIVATLYVCYFSHLGAIGFVGPDEPRYAWVARDMAETGDWVTPRLYGKPWFEKPPLYYWGAALCFKLFGVSETAARLPSAVSALLATLALAWLALRLYGVETARWLLLLLPTTVGMIGFSHAAATDMPFAGMLTIAMVCAAVLIGLVPSATPTRSPTLLPAVLFGVFLGLAVLAKGPAGIVLCGGGVLFWTLFTKRWRDAFRLLHPAAIAAFCVTALPWYILCARRNPDFFRVFIIEHNFKRYLTAEFQHIQPFWFYAPILLLAFLPWTVGFLWVVATGLPRLWQNHSLNQATLLLASYSGFCVAFFTISRSKLPGYVLPAMPVIALILAPACVSLTAKRNTYFGIISLAVGVGWLFLMFRESDVRSLHKFEAFQPLIKLCFFMFLATSILLGAGALARSRSARTIVLASSVLPVILLLWCWNAVSLHEPLFVLSARYLAEDIHKSRKPLDQLCISDLNRSTVFALNYYLHVELRGWNHDPSAEVYLLTEGSLLPCREQPTSMACSDLWVEQERLDTFSLLHLVPKRQLTTGAGPGGQAQ